MRKGSLSDPLADARVTIAALQLALDRAQTRIRDGERTIGELNERLAEQTECRDRAEIRLAMLDALAQNRAGATPAFRDVSP